MQVTSDVEMLKSHLSGLQFHLDDFKRKTVEKLNYMNNNLNQIKKNEVEKTNYKTSFFKFQEWINTAQATETTSIGAISDTSVVDALDTAFLHDVRDSP